MAIFLDLGGMARAAAVRTRTRQSGWVSEERRKKSTIVGKSRQRDRSIKRRVRPARLLLSKLAKLNEKFKYL